MEKKVEHFHRALADITGRDCSQVCHMSIATTTPLANAKRDERKSRISTRFARKSTFSPKDVPRQADAFVEWFESLREHGPGQGDPLFPWLEHSCDLEQMKWFLEQEVSGEAGFDDLVALTQVKMPLCANSRWRAITGMRWQRIAKGHAWSDAGKSRPPSRAKFQTATSGS